MPVQRLDLKTARYDRLSRSVLIDGRAVTVEVSHEALEAMARRTLDADQAVQRALAESKRITTLMMRVPEDDGKVHITAGLVANDGRLDREERS